MEEIVVKEIELDDDQLKAIEICTDRKQRLVGVSGAAGSGKTTLIKKLADALDTAGITWALCAPTGKAARRIKEATGLDAVTIHRLLEYNRPGEYDEKTGKPLDISRPKRDRTNPLSVQVVIADEYAMVPVELHNNLLAALPSGGCLRAFGDINQLPPIEEYKVTDNRGVKSETPFVKILNSFVGIELKRVYRQAEGSDVLVAASKICKGHTPQINNAIDAGFRVKFTEQPINELKAAIIEYRDKHGIDYSMIENQVIVPGKNTWVGTEKLNVVLRALLNPKPVQSMALDRHAWDKEPCTIGIGDKVVCTANTYDLRPYFERYTEWTDDQRPLSHSYIPCPPTKQMLNGETGVVTAIHPDNSIEIDFGDRIVELPYMYDEYWAKNDSVIPVIPNKSIALAFALTTHKCQGSEFKNVIYVLNKSSQFTQSRQNFYTAASRARNSSFIITDQISFRTSIAKVK